MLNDHELPDFSSVFAYPGRELTERQQGRDRNVPDISIESLLPYYHRHMLNVARSENTADLIKKKNEEGRLFRSARKHAGLFVVELAADLRQRHCPTTYEELLALEAGLITAKDMPEPFIDTYKQILIGRLERTFCRN